jgi:hypothetical protein
LDGQPGVGDQPQQTERTTAARVAVIRAPVEGEEGRRLRPLSMGACRKGAFSTQGEACQR